MQKEVVLQAAEGRPTAQIQNSGAASLTHIVAERYCCQTGIRKEIQRVYSKGEYRSRVQSLQYSVYNEFRPASLENSQNPSILGN